MTYYDIIISGNILKINLVHHQIFVNSSIFKSNPDSAEI